MLQSVMMALGLTDHRVFLILSLFLSYIFGSYFSLRLGLASQKVPTNTTAISGPRPMEMVNAGARGTLQLTYHAVNLMLILSTLGRLLNCSILVMLAMVILVPLVSLGVALFSGLRLSLHRDQNGVLSLEPRYSDHTLVYRASYFTLTAALQVAVIWYRSDVGAAVMFFMGMYLIGILMNPRTTSIRKMMIWFIIADAILLCCVAVIFSIPVQNRRFLHHSSRWHESFSQRISMLYIVVPLSRFFLDILRFDFSNHVANVETAQGFPVELVLEEVVVSAERPTTGVIVPSAIPFAFMPPYFISALFGWLLANFAAIQITPRDDATELYGHAVWLLLVAPPMMILSVFIMSVMRGEVMHMWSYEGHWDLQPSVEKAAGDIEKGGGLVDVCKKPESARLI